MSEEEKVETTGNQAVEDNSPTLEEKVEAQLAAMHNETADDEVKEDGEKKDTEQEVIEETQEDNTNEEAAESDDSPILPAGHRRAALADGWTTEEVDYYLESNPEGAMEHFASIYNDWREENSRWSARGRQLKAADQDTNPSATTPNSTGDNKLKPMEKFDTQALIEEHGNDELVTALTSKMNNMIDQINPVLEKVAASQEFVESSTEETISKIAQDFFGGKEMESFKDVYGTDYGTATQEQIDKRMELFGEADDIIFGASAHGKQITVEEALKRAHNNVSEGSKDTAIRDSIRKGLKKRTKTLSGSKQKITSTGDDNAPLTREELVARTNDRLRAMHHS